MAINQYFCSSVYIYNSIIIYRQNGHNHHGPPLDPTLNHYEAAPSINDSNPLYESPPPRKAVVPPPIGDYEGNCVENPAFTRIDDEDEVGDFDGSDDKLNLIDD